MPALLVSESSYRQLLDYLQSDTPRSLSIIGSLRNVLRGRLTANFFVDKWPDYSAVVCQYIWPRRSDVADIGAYATSSEALLSVLTDGDLVTWGRRQEFQRIEADHADYLLKHLRPLGARLAETGLLCIHKRISVYYDDILQLNGSIEKSLEKFEKLLPEGYIVGKLQPHHAKIVTSHWPRLHDWPNKEPYFRELIKNYYCPAVYSLDNLEEPVSYTVQFPCNQSFGYTDDKHKGQRLVSIPGLYYILSALGIDGYSPCEEEVSHPARVSVFTDIGGQLSGYNVKDLVTRHSQNSKL